MVCCSNSSTLLAGALRRASFYCAQARLGFILLAIALHAALLSSLPQDSIVLPHRWQGLSAHVEQRHAVQTVSLASVQSPHATHALIPVKKKQVMPVADSSMPKAIAASPAESRSPVMTAAPPQAAPAPAGPVVGIALPQSDVMSGRRRFWSFQPAGQMPSGQVLRQMQMQREATLAMQAGLAAEREKFEAQLVIKLQDLHLNSACRVLMSVAKAARLHCEEERDTSSVRTVLEQAGMMPGVQSDGTWLVIDLTPRQSGGAQAVSHHESAEPS
jgi:hypothetical protein